MDQDRNKTSSINFGLRYFAAAMVLIHSVPSIVAYFGFGYIKFLYSEYLAGKPLPYLSQIVLGSGPLLFAIPMIVVLVSAGVLITSKSRQMPYYVAATGMVCFGVFTFVFYVGLLLPMLQVIPVLP